MTPQEREVLGKAIVCMAEYYNRKISRETVSMMVDDLEDLPLDRVLSAYREYRRNSKNTAFPTPGSIRAIIRPEVDDRAVAVEIARKIDRACIRHGFYWAMGTIGPGGMYWEDDKGVRHPSFKEAVMAELGPIGWSVISSRGGWEQVAQGANESEEGVFHAQLRDQVASTIALSRNGVDVAGLDMPTRERPQLAPPSNVLKLIEPKEIP